MSRAARAWSGYAVAALVLVGALFGLSTLLVTDAVRTGLLVAAGAAWALQLVAFAVLLAVRDRPQMFMVGFAGGMLLRVGIVVGAGLWLRATGVFPALPTMIGFVGFLFVLLLLEAVFLQKGETGGR